MIESYAKKYQEAGAVFNASGQQTQQSAVDQRVSKGLADPTTQDNTLLYIFGAVALAGILK